MPAITACSAPASAAPTSIRRPRTAAAGITTGATIAGSPTIGVSPPRRDAVLILRRPSGAGDGVVRLHPNADRLAPRARRAAYFLSLSLTSAGSSAGVELRAPA